MSFLIYQKQSPEFLNNYLKYKRYITFSANTTIDEAYFDIRSFFRYIKLSFYMKDKVNEITKEEFENIEILDITLDDLNNVTRDTISNYLVFLNYTLNNCPKTRNRKLASIKRLFEYLEIHNLIITNPTKFVKTAKIEKRLPKYLTLTESKKLLANTINSDDKYKIRNYAIICLFLNCSLRLSELVRINLTDIKLDEKTLKVCGKGNRERIIYLNEACIEVIEEYLKVRPKLDKSFVDYNALFISSQKKRISRKTVQDIVKTKLENAFEEKEKDLHTHSLRHSSASMMYNENDTNILIIRRILGHKSLSATEIYTHVSPKKLRDIMENCTISSILERKNKEELNQ